MTDECFNCASSASEQYTLVLESGKILEDKVLLEDKMLCEECLAVFREVEWIGIAESPVLKRGGSEDQEA